jgi:RND family efflux transporter MFP subunit
VATGVLFLIVSISAAIAYASGYVPSKGDTYTGEVEVRQYVPKNAELDASPAAMIQKLPYTRTLDSVGTVRAQKEAQLSTKASGRLHTLNVEVGTAVGQGYLIAQTSGEEQYAQLESAKRSLDNATTSVDQTKGLMDQQVESSKAQADTARASLEVLETSRQNLDTTAEEQIQVAQKQVELAQVAYDTAPEEEKPVKQKQLEIAQQQLEELVATMNAQKEKLSEEIDVAKKRVDQANAGVGATERQRDLTITNAETQQDSTEDGVTLAQVMVNNTLVHAPFYGVIVEKQAEIGQFVQAGSPIVTIADTNFLIRTEIADSDIARIEEGQAAEIELDGLSSTFSATVTKIYPTVDERTRTFPVELSFETMPENLKYGQSAQVRIHKGETAAYFIPRRYIQPSFDGPYIVFADGTKQLVDTGVEQDGMIEIFYPGITDGREVVDEKK